MNARLFRLHDHFGIVLLAIGLFRPMGRDVSFEDIQREITDAAERMQRATSDLFKAVGKLELALNAPSTPHQMSAFKVIDIAPASRESVEPRRDRPSYELMQCVAVLHLLGAKSTSKRNATAATVTDNLAAFSPKSKKNRADPNGVPGYLKIGVSKGYLTPVGNGFRLTPHAEDKLALWLKRGALIKSN